MTWCRDRNVLGVGAGFVAAASALVVVDEPLARLITLGSAAAALIVVACMAWSTLIRGTQTPAECQGPRFAGNQCKLGLEQCHPIHSARICR